MIGGQDGRRVVAGWSGSPRGQCGQSGHIHRAGDACVAPVLGVAGEQQDLVAAGAVVQDALHLFAALGVAVYQCVVQDQKGGLAGLLQQVGIGQAGDHAELLARAQAVFVQRQAGAVALQFSGAQLLYRCCGCGVGEE